MEKIFHRLFVPVICCICLVSSLQAQVIHYVKSGGTGDGSTWSNASGNFQAMIDASSAGDEVWVAAGDYRTPRNQTFNMKEGVKLFGGFPNTGSPGWGDRNFVANTTRLLGNLRSWDYDGNRVIENMNNGLSVASVLDGFTITEGNIRHGGHGGGMYNSNASPTISNCVFTGNNAGNEGGAMYNAGSNPAISNCTFSNNSSGLEVDGQGGAIANYYSHPTITNSLFNNNNVVRGGVANGGGGLYNFNSNPVVTNCRFTNNSGYSAGGVHNVSSSPQFIHTLFSGNEGAHLGGAVYNFSSTPVFRNCSIIDNVCSNGAGVANAYYSNSVFLNCVFVGNVSNSNGGNGRGGAFYNDYAIANITNCTFTANFASLYGGAIYSNGFAGSYAENVILRNSIIHGNNSGIYLYNNIANFEYNLIEQHTPHGGNVTVRAANNIPATTAPLFVNAGNPVGADGIWGTADDGLQLQANSSLVNNGTNGAVPVDLLTDITGVARIHGGTVDLGAYESPYSVNCGFTTLYVDDSRSISGMGNSWGTAFKTLSEAMQRARDCNNVNTILVAKGTYYPTGLQNSTDRDSAFVIPQRGGLKIYGGYPNGGGARNIISNPTTLSGDIGIGGDNNDNSYHLLVFIEALPGADSVVLDGLTLTRANANGGQYHYNNTLTNQSDGAAILFRNNSNIGSKLAIRNCIITNNNASVSGAGIYLWESSALISNCVIADNHGATNGGGLFNLSNTATKLINTVMNGNAAQHGAAIYNNNASLDIVNCTIAGNLAGNQGSGIYNTSASNMSVVNSILYNNSSNNIFNNAALTISYSNVQQASGVYSGTGNINEDPVFSNYALPSGADNVWRTADDGLQLMSASGCVNAGTPDVSALPLNLFDLKSGLRVQMGRIDMGAYESQFINCQHIPGTLYVDGSVAQSGNGSSWQTAFKTVTDAMDVLNTCNTVTTILVAKGTYYPAVSANRDATFLVPRRGNVKLYGGYPNGGGERDHVNNPTILSGDIGVLNNDADNSYHVMVIVNTNAAADSVVVDGFTFADANGSDITSNSLNGRNVVRNTGGGLAILHNNGNTKIAVRNCRFIGNRAHQGGGIYNAGSAPSIINCSLQGNFSTDNGGGMSNYENAAPVLINVLIAGNQASYGGAFFNDNSSARFFNSTIAGNYASEAGGFYNRYSNANLYFRNSVLYGNRKNDGTASNIFNISDGKAHFMYSLIENAAGAWIPAFGTDEGHNLFSDPLFVNYSSPTNTNTPNSNGNYQLQNGSPLVNAGDNTLLPATIETDLAGAARIQQGTIDPGAFESPYINCSTFKIDTTHKNISCYGSPTGEASVTISQGTAPFTYNWSNGANTSGITNLLPGDYTCTVTDGIGCIITKTFAITEPATALSVTPTAEDIRCTGNNDGTAAINASGGTTPYSYQWSNGAITADLDGLSPGTYTCTVTDANGCSISGSVTVDQPAEMLAITVSQNDVLCFGNNTGTASVQASGGVAPYSYLWSDGSSTASLTDLVANTYSCTITDANGCEVTKALVITEPTAITYQVMAQQNIYCGQLNTGSVLLQASGGIGVHTYSWSNGASTADNNGLSAGTYQCTITDENSCTLDVSVTITQQTITGNKIFVDNSVAISGDGASWATAFRDLSEAMEAAAACTQVDSILVAAGTYTPTGSSQVIDRNATFLVRQQGALNISGGYPTRGGMRDPAANPTILSGVIGGMRSCHLMVIAGIDPAADSIVIDGFTISGGSASTNTSFFYNGIEVPGNKGAGIYLHDNGGAGKVAIRNCSFTGNLSHASGGAVYIDHCAPVISSCSFEANIAYTDGGAIAVDNVSNPLIEYGIFINNEGVNGGGGIYTGPGSRIIIRNARFLNNTSTGWGGGGAIYNAGSVAEIRDCYIAGNTALFNLGGGAVFNDNASVDIINNYIIGNRAQSSYGGGILNRNAVVRMINCTLYGNQGDASSGTIYNDGSQLAITNTILCGTDYGIAGRNGGNINVNYSIVLGWYGPGTGNPDPNTDPGFVAPASSSRAPFTEGDYRLQACSPVINLGTADTSGLKLSLLDAETGLPRIQLGRVDMGANEANSFTNGNAAFIPLTAGSTSAFQRKDGTTWYAIDCDLLIAAVTGSGASPVTGNTSANVDIDNTQLPGSVGRVYEITPENDAATASGTITLYFTQTDFNDYNTANAATNKLPLPDKDDPDRNEDFTNIRIRKVSNGVETIIIPHTIAWNELHGRWELSFDVTGFSTFHVFTEDNTILPLTLLGFTARSENCTAKISWTTAGEMAVAHFEVEHSTDGAAWQPMAQLAARNSVTENKYNTDLSIHTATNFYRLKMVDKDGTVTYSKVVRLMASSDCAGQMVQLWPNPVKDVLYAGNAGQGDSYGIYDNTGKLLMRGVVRKQVQDIPVSGLIRGIYSIVFVTKKGEIRSFKFIKK